MVLADDWSLLLIQSTQSGVVAYRELSRDSLSKDLPSTGVNGMSQ